MFATLTWNRAEMLLPIGIGIALVIVLAWGLDALRSRQRYAIGCGVLKLLAIGAIGCCLAEPLWSGLRAVPGENLLLIVSDESESLAIREGSEAITRREIQTELLTGTGAEWQTTLETNFEVQRYSLSPSLSGPEEKPTTTTDLNGTLAAIRKRFASRPVAGVVMMTDGVSTSEIDRETLANGPPIYPVIPSRADALPDLAIQSVSVTPSGFEDAPATITATVTSTHPEPQRVGIVCEHTGGEVIATEHVTLSATESERTVRFPVKPTGTGPQFYRLSFIPENAFEEATAQNNSHTVVVQRPTRKKRVLYVSGRPDWEFKFLRRSIESDDQLQLTGLIRIAKREAKFEWRGRAGQSSNALYRGFEPEADAETEAHDEAVYLRIDTESPDELKNGFPTAKEDLYRFDAVILDDVEGTMLPQASWDLLRNFVSERGGGLLWLGGEEAFSPSDAKRVGLADLWPITLDGRPAFEPDRSYRWELTREGWLQPWLRTERVESDERRRLDELPAMKTWNRIGRVKPGGQVLAVVRDQTRKTHPALISRRFGRGLTMAMPIGDRWRMQLAREESTGPEVFERLWRQMLRRLTVDVPSRAEFLTAGVADAEPIAIRVRDAEFEPSGDAVVTMTIERTGEPDLTFEAEPSLNEPGLFITHWRPRDAGEYRLRAEVRSEGEEEPMLVTRGIVHAPLTEEFSSITPNRELLHEIALASGGRVIPERELSGLNDELVRSEVPVREAFSTPLWNEPWMFLFACCCLLGEWALRRRGGLS